MPLSRDLKVLELGDGFNQPLKGVNWTEGLKEVKLGNFFLSEHGRGGVT